MRGGTPHHQARPNPTATQQGVRRPAAPTGRVALPRDHGAEWNLRPVRRDAIVKHKEHREHKGTKGFNAGPQGRRGNRALKPCRFPGKGALGARASRSLAREGETRRGNVLVSRFGTWRGGTPHLLARPHPPPTQQGVRRPAAPTGRVVLPCDHRDLQMGTPFARIFSSLSRSGEMADAADSKSAASDGMWVRLPPPAPFWRHFPLEVPALVDDF